MCTDVKKKKKTGLTIFTSFKIECISELGKDYRVKIKESVGKGTLRLHKTTCGVQDISNKVTEIGAFPFVKWDKVKSEQKWMETWKPKGANRNHLY